MDYKTHHPDTINFIPPDEALSKFEKDYALMREQMIYNEYSKDFDTIIGRLKELLERFRKVSKK